jgi:hypothetical protein
MVDFRTKLITLVGMTVAFAGMAFGQTGYATVVAAPNSVTQVNTNFIRAEGTTELVGSSSINIQQGTLAATVTLQVFVGTGTTNVSPLNITSPSGAGAPQANGVSGTVGGTSVTFSNIAVPVCAQTVPGTCNAGTVTSVTVTNIRVNSNGVTQVANAPPIPVSVQYYVTGNNVTPAETSPVPVAFVLNGLGAVKQTLAANSVPTNTTCTNVTNATLQYTVSVTEGFATSFKTIGDEGVAATSGTRITLNFANVPTGVAVYVPLNVLSTTTTNGLPGGPLPLIQANLQLVNNQTGTPVPASASSATGAPALSGAVAIGNIANGVGTGTAVYQTSVDNQGLIDLFPINVIYVSSANAVSPTSAATVTVSFAPISSATDVPNFSSTGSTATVSGSTYVSCSTTLLFPYVLNPTPWETGLAIANASIDTLKTGGGSSVGTSQAGTCALSFFGNATPANNPAAYTTPSVAAGTTWSNTLTMTAGASFTGYVIANCNFQYAHGFAYIVNSFGTANQMAMGYTAKVLPVARALGVGAVETLGE